MVRARRRTRQSLSSTSSNEDSSSSHAKKRPNLGSTSEVKEMAATKNKDETPSLARRMENTKGNKGEYGKSCSRSGNSKTKQQNAR